MSKEVPERVKKFISERKNTSVRVKHPKCLDHSNDDFDIYEGQIVLEFSSLSIEIDCIIRHRWFPESGVIFKGNFKGDAMTLPDLFGEKYSVKIKNRNVGFGYLIGAEQKVNGLCEGSIDDLKLHDIEIPVHEIRFCLANMRVFPGLPIRLDERSLSDYPGRLIFKSGDFTIYLDQVLDYKQKKQRLKYYGGYSILYTGKIFKKHGLITLKEFTEWHDRFHTFLSFINGRRVAPIFYTGFLHDKEEWADYTNYYKSPYKEVNCWSKGLDYKHIESVWNEFDKLWNKKENLEFLHTLTFWYFEANSFSGKVKGSIILIQSALELLINWYLIENKGEEFSKKTPAATKIKKLINPLKIGDKVPLNFVSLNSYMLETNYKDGPSILAHIRNVLVHADKKNREKLYHISEAVLEEALQLGIWYVELSFLFILGYKENYNNRTDGNNLQPLPWLTNT